MQFSEWKTRMMTKLIKLASEAKSEWEITKLTTLIRYLKDLRRPVVASWLAELCAYCVNFKKMDLCSEAVGMLEKVEEGEED